MCLTGEGGIKKTHLAAGLCLAACLQKRHVCFITAAALVNDLREVKQQHEPIPLDEVGYVTLAGIGVVFHCRAIF
jgi:DNA replication protein DnaC